MSSSFAPADLYKGQQVQVLVANGQLPGPPQRFADVAATFTGTANQFAMSRTLYAPLYQFSIQLTAAQTQAVCEWND
jgi:hypothetical protein